MVMTLAIVIISILVLAGIGVGIYFLTKKKSTSPVITLTIVLNSWSYNGKVVRKGSIIAVTAPSCFLYVKTNWFVESVVYSGDAQKEIATLTCVLPCVYDGSTPVNVFVNPHENLPRF